MQCAGLLNAFAGAAYIQGQLNGFVGAAYIQGHRMPQPEHGGRSVVYSSARCPVCWNTRAVWQRASVRRTAVDNTDAYAPYRHAARSPREGIRRFKRSFWI